MNTEKKKPYTITRNKVIIDYGALYCDTPEKLLKSDLFFEIVDRFIEKIASNENSNFSFIKTALSPLKREELTAAMVSFFRLLASHTAEEVVSMKGEFRPLVEKKEQLFDFIDELYNYWRRLERFIYIEAPRRSGHKDHSIDTAQFISSNETFKTLVLTLYRKVMEHLMGSGPKIYRQLPSGANMGMLVEKIEWDCPFACEAIRDIPFIRLALIEPPLILYPRKNTRKGGFKEIFSFDEKQLSFEANEWYCFPAKIGDMLAFVYFHHDYISLGLSLGNLFEMAGPEEIEGKRPDLILFFGLPQENCPGDTVFYEHKESGIFMGFVNRTEDVDYFGYFKKMALTLHNVAKLNRERLPLHGAMVYIKLRNGKSANIVLVGDSGAGKSETIEAFRAEAQDHVCELKVIFDDMGSLGFGEDGKVLGYGTEIGAFVRLDDLSPGYAYEQLDRSIFMNPHLINSRLIIPITRYHHIVRGYPVSMILYANNYDMVNDEYPAIEFFSEVGPALYRFRSGARMAKGTTDEKGLVHTYFANPFGAPQRKEQHERIAEKYFNAMFDGGVRIGQIRTRLGIAGFERKGPEEAARELFRIINEQ